MDNRVERMRLCPTCHKEADCSDMDNGALKWFCWECQRSWDVMSLLKDIKAEVIIEVGNLPDAITGLCRGMESRGVNITAELNEFMCNWFRANTVANIGHRITELSSRLARHECVEHDPPKFGECAVCDGFKAEKKSMEED